MKPIIGITTSHEGERKLQLNTNYAAAVIRAGGIPLLLPMGIEEDFEQVTDMLDGLLLTGGGDIDPILFNEEPHQKLGEVSPTRDAFEIGIAKAVLAADKPILGICKGLQIINVALGGTLIQDIYSQCETPPLLHSQKAPRKHPTHFVQVEKDSILSSISESAQISVNSFHHQAVGEVAGQANLSAWAADGVVEAIELPDARFVLGVQWHPEIMTRKEDEASRRLFSAFAKAARG